MAVIEHILKLEGVAGAARDLDKLGKSAKAAGEDLTDSLDKAGNSAGKLGQGLGVLSPSLGAASMAVADIADGLLALTTPTGLATAAVVGLGAAAVGGVAALAGLVVGLGAMGLAADDALKSLEGFKLIGSDIYPVVDPATLQSIKELNAAMDALVSIGQLATVAIGGNVGPAFASMGKAAVGAGLEVLDAIRAITDSQSVLRLVAVGAVHAISAPLFALLQPLAAIQDGYAALADVVGVEVAPAMRDNLKQVEALHLRFSQAVVDTVDLSAQSSVLAGLYGELEQRGGAFVDQQIRATDALEATTTATDRQAEALQRLAEAQRDAAAARDYDLSLGEREIQLQQQREAMASTFAAAGGMGAAFGEALQGAQAAQQTQGIISTANQVGGIAGALSGGAGGIAGAVSQIGTMAGAAAAGPIVAAIMQIIQLVTAIVPEDGGQGLLDQIHATIMEFFGDIGELPGVLARFMQDTIREGIPAMFDVIPSLIEGIIENIPVIIEATLEQFPLMIGGLLQMVIATIPEAIVKGLITLFNPEFWAQVFKGLVESLKDALGGLFGGGAGSTYGKGGFFDQIFVGPKEKAAGERSVLGSRASGDDFIPRTGLYMMHRGEVVSGNGRLPPGAQSGRSQPPVVIQGSVYGIDDLARAMREARRRGVSFG